MDRLPLEPRTDNPAPVKGRRVRYDKDEVNGFWQWTGRQSKRILLRNTRSDSDFLRQQDELKKKLRRKDQVTIKTTYEDLDSLMRDCIDRASAARNTHYADNSFATRVGRNTVGFMVKCHEYIEAYSGVVQLMEGVGQGYGQAAYEALSILLMVAVNKNQTETTIEFMLETLSREYGRIGRLEAIYATEEMHEYVAKVYTLGMDFLQDAVRYYGFKPHKRFLHALAKPPRVDLQGRVSAIQGAIDLLVKERDTLDSIRLANVEKVAEENLDLTLSAKVESRIERLRQMLGVPDEDNLIRLSRYQETLEDTFKVKKFRPFDFEEKMLRNKAFQEWDAEDSSGFLVVTGKTVAPHNTHLSWVSPAATGVIRLNEESITVTSPRDRTPNGAGNTGMLFYCCQDAEADLKVSPERLPPTTVVSALIFQLLRLPRARRILQSDVEYEKLRQEIGKVSPAGEKEDRSSQVRLLYWMLGDLLKKLSFEKIYLVLDRPDCVSHHETTLRLCMDLVKAIPKGLKILVVGQDISPDFLADSQEKAGFRRLVFDQTDWF